jgi:uncharacterized RDD family membrane protein YckC
MISDEESFPARRPAFDETHRVETPEQTHIEFTVAGVGSRGLALAIDTLIQFVVFALLFAGVFSLGAGGKLRAANVWVAAALIVAGFLLYYGYFIFFEIVWSGQTPGKRSLGIRVIKDSGRRLSALETIARNLLRIVDQLPGFYAVGMFVCLLNSRNKRLGDLVAGSIVIREQSASRARTRNSDLDAARLRARPSMGADRLTDDELILIESFLDRRWELEPGIRWRMANDIFRRVEGKLNFAPEERAAVEHLLEAAVDERRTRSR